MIKQNKILAAQAQAKVEHPYASVKQLVEYTKIILGQQLDDELIQRAAREAVAGEAME